MTIKNKFDWENVAEDAFKGTVVAGGVIGVVAGVTYMLIDEPAVGLCVALSLAFGVGRAVYKEYKRNDEQLYMDNTSSRDTAWRNFTYGVDTLDNRGIYVFHKPLGKVYAGVYNKDTDALYREYTFYGANTKERTAVKDLDGLRFKRTA